MPSLILRHGDITRLALDAIVNAANPALMGGGGVDAMIHQAAGPELLEACLALPEISPGVRCPTGEARITPGFKLPARWVVHTVGPIWRGGHDGETGLLAASYRNAAALALQNGAASLAFPAISCGAYGFPYAAATRVALRTLATCLTEAMAPATLILCPYDSRGAELYHEAAQVEGVPLIEG